MIKYKTFKDLKFENRKCFLGGGIARLCFPNGYGVSVITGDSFSRTSKSKPYEVAVLFDNKLCYSTPITNSVIGWSTEEDVTEIMKKVQQLKN